MAGLAASMVNSHNWCVDHPIECTEASVPWFEADKAVLRNAPAAPHGFSRRYIGKVIFIY